MTNAETVAYFQDLVNTNKLLISFFINTTQMKEATRSAVDYPCLVLHEDFEMMLEGQPDTPLLTESRSVMVLAQASSEMHEDVIEAQDIAREALIQVVAYIITRNNAERANGKNGKYIKIHQQPIRPVLGYGSDKLYGYRLYYTHQDSTSFTKKIDDWI
jgi:hypothetical protein